MPLSSTAQLHGCIQCRFRLRSCSCRCPSLCTHHYHKPILFRIRRSRVAVVALLRMLRCGQRLHVRLNPFSQCFIVTLEHVGSGHGDRFVGCPCAPHPSRRYRGTAFGRVMCFQEPAVPRSRRQM
jgi:hypothetical protein